MLKLTSFLLLVTAIIGLSSAHQQNPQPDNQISFFNRKDTVLLQHEDYTLLQRQAGFDVLVLNKSKLKKIAKLIAPQSQVTSNDHVYRAVGVNILSSRIPDIGDYFFPVNGDGRIVVFKGNILNFKKVNY